MPFNGFTQQAYAQKMIDEYKAAGRPRDVWPQSFDNADVLYWIKREPRFGRQAVYLDDAQRAGRPADARELAGYKAEGINIWAPPTFALLALDAGGNIVPSQYARDAKAAGLDIITWTLERSGILADGNNGFYYQTIDSAIKREGDLYEVIDVLAKDVGVLGVFSDWAAPVTFYANCMGSNRFARDAGTRAKDGAGMSHQYEDRAQQEQQQHERRGREHEEAHDDHVARRLHERVDDAQRDVAPCERDADAVDGVRELCGERQRVEQRRLLVQMVVVVRDARDFWRQVELRTRARHRDEIDACGAQRRNARRVEPHPHDERPADQRQNGRNEAHRRRAGAAVSGDAGPPRAATAPRSRD